MKIKIEIELDFPSEELADLPTLLGTIGGRLKMSGLPDHSVVTEIRGHRTTWYALGRIIKDRFVQSELAELRGRLE